MDKKRLSHLILLIVLLAACGSKPATASPLPATSTVEGSPTLPTPLAGTSTSIPTFTVTPATVAGTLKMQVNVRSGPGTGYQSLGLLNAGQTVQVTAQSSDGTWFQVLYPTAPGGLGWVSAQFLDTGSKPVPSLTSQVTPITGPAGTLSQRLNVRSGPGTNYATFGTLEANTTVALTGKNETGTWLQIAYPSAPDGRGWVTAAYVQVASTFGLPVLNALGTPVTPGSMAGTTAPGVTPTPTLGPAAADGDTSARPLARVLFSPLGTKKFEFQGDVSIPEGDPEDWIEFTPYALPGGVDASLTVNLGCSGTGTLVVELWQNGAPIPNWGTLACGDIGRSFLLPASGAYQFRLRPAPGNGLQYIHYWLTMRNNP
jgi:uncharacterized protein YraI